MGDLLRALGVARALFRLVGRHKLAGVLSVVVALGWFLVSCDPAGAVSLGSAGGHPLPVAAGGANTVRGGDVITGIVYSVALAGYGVFAYGLCWGANWLMHNGDALLSRVGDSIAHHLGRDRRPVAADHGIAHGDGVDAG